jgi:excisionase family DNA binding protein
MEKNEVATAQTVAAPRKRDAAIQPLYLRPAKAARLIDVGRSKMYELIQTGEVRAIVVGGCLRVPMSEIEALGERLKARSE